MVIELIDSQELIIKQREYWSQPLPFQNSENFALFDISVNNNLDISAYLLDDANFQIWIHNLQAQRAGARRVGLPIVTMFSSMKLHFGTLSFKPQIPGLYYLVLDNTYSINTPKRIMLSTYKLQVEDDLRRSLREVTSKRGWNDVWTSFEQADNYLSQGSLASCCDSLRRGLLNLWIKVCETLSGKPVHIDTGKATDIGVLKEQIRAYTPEYTISPITLAWSLTSELSKTERRGGEEPPLNQVLLAHRITYAAAVFLIAIRVGVI